MKLTQRQLEDHLWGEYFTPPEVVDILVRILEKKVKKIRIAASAAARPSRVLSAAMAITPLILHIVASLTEREGNGWQVETIKPIRRK